MSAWLGIVNPHAGGRAVQHRLRGVLDRLGRDVCNLLFTGYPGHATALARDARGYDGLAVAGGDGTVFEVLQGMDRQKQTLAIVPLGRGNSLARDLGLYPPSGAVPLASARALRIDLVEVAFEDSRGARHNVVAASTIALGYPAEAAAMAGRRFRRFGKLSYGMAAACVVPRFRRMHVSYSGEESAEKRLTGFLASNTCHAANFAAFPDACCHDGSFEAMELAAGFAGQSLHTVSTLSRLQFYGPPARGNLTRVSVACEDPGELLVDGELYPDVVSVELQVLPAALACASNRGAP